MGNAFYLEQIKDYEKKLDRAKNYIAELEKKLELKDKPNHHDQNTAQIFDNTQTIDREKFQFYLNQMEAGVYEKFSIGKFTFLKGSIFTVDTHDHKEDDAHQGTRPKDLFRQMSEGECSDGKSKDDKPPYHDLKREREPLTNIKDDCKTSGYLYSEPEIKKKVKTYTTNEANQTKGIEIKLGKSSITINELTKEELESICYNITFYSFLTPPNPKSENSQRGEHLELLFRNALLNYGEEALDLFALDSNRKKIIVEIEFLKPRKSNPKECKLTKRWLTREGSTTELGITSAFSIGNDKAMLIKQPDAKTAKKPIFDSFSLSSNITTETFDIKRSTQWTSKNFQNGKYLFLTGMEFECDGLIKTRRILGLAELTKQYPKLEIKNKNFDTVWDDSYIFVNSKLNLMDVLKCLKKELTFIRQAPLIIRNFFIVCQYYDTRSSELIIRKIIKSDLKLNYAIFKVVASFDSETNDLK